MDKKHNILNILVNLINQFDNLTFGISLNVGGQIISGELISYNSYLRGIAEEIGTVNNEVSEVLQDMFNILADKEEEFVNKLKNIDKDDDRKNLNNDPLYIHLKNVEIIENKQVSVSAQYWRGKISSVDGFIVGKLE